MSHTLPPNDDIAMATSSPHHPPSPPHPLATPPSSVFGSALPSPPPHPPSDGGIAPAAVSMFSVHVAPPNLENVLRRYMPVQDVQCAVPEPDVYVKHKEKDMFVHGKSSASEFLLYMRRSIQHKVRVRTLPNMHAVMSWVQCALDHVSCSRFLELYWDSIEEAANRYDPAHPDPEAYVLFLQHFTAHFVPRLDEGELYTRYARLLSGGELTLTALHDWTLEVRNASAAVVGTEYWAPRKELDSLQSCARIPMDILVAVNATHPADFRAFLSSLEIVARGRMKMLAKRQRANAKSTVAAVHFSGDEARDEALHQQGEVLQQQVAALQMQGGGGRGKLGGGKGGAVGKGGGGASGGAKGETSGEGKIRCFVCAVVFRRVVCVVCLMHVAMRCH